jgi:CO/xanthine dehydrogenase Mo-binding subunit
MESKHATIREAAITKELPCHHRNQNPSYQIQSFQQASLQEQIRYWLQQQQPSALEPEINDND